MKTKFLLLFLLISCFEAPTGLDVKIEGIKQNAMYLSGINNCMSIENFPGRCLYLIYIKDNSTVRISKEAVTNSQLMDYINEFHNQSVSQSAKEGGY